MCSYIQKGDLYQVFGKYKPVGKKVKPILGEVMPEFRIERNIIGDPLKDLPEMPVHPPEYIPTGRYGDVE